MEFFLYSLIANYAFVLVLLALFWFLAIGVWAHKYGRYWWVHVPMAILLTPLISALILIALGKTRERRIYEARLAHEIKMEAIRGKSPEQEEAHRLDQERVNALPMHERVEELFRQRTAKGI